MKLFSSVPLSIRLPVSIIAASLLVVGLVSVVSYQRSVATLMETVSEAKKTLLNERSAYLQSLLEQMQQDVAGSASSPGVRDAVSRLGATFNLFDDAQSALQAAYIDNNPNPVGQKDLLDRAEAPDPYHLMHADIHPHFREVKNARQYYDIFIFNTEGDLVYSVYKEADYATNFASGPYADSGLGDVFNQAINGVPGQTYYADFQPYAPSAGAFAAFLAVQIVNDWGDVVGVYAVQVPTTHFNKVLQREAGLGDTAEVYLVGPDGRLRSPLRGETLSPFEMMPASSFALGALDGTSAETTDSTGLSGYAIAGQAVPLEFLGTTWALAAEIQLSEMLQPAVELRNISLVIAAISAVMVGGLGWLVARSVVAPLARLEGSMNAIALKDFDADIADSERGDEVGRLVGVAIDMRDKLRAASEAELAQIEEQQEQVRVVERLSVALDRLADGDLTRQIDTPFKEDYDQLRKDYNRSVGRLHEIMLSLSSRATEIDIRATAMTEETGELARRTETQAATLEETAAALTELTENVREAADGASEIDEIVGRTRADADASAPVVKNAVEAMSEIEKTSGEITQIIGVIDDIAFQTNLLALNAGVEAARAGEAGRGFAVVASEVRALAQRSSDAAREIKGLISGSSAQVSRGVELVNETGEVLNKIVDGIVNISGLMAGIANGAQEQSVGLGEINIGVAQLDQVTQQNAAMVEEATAGSMGLRTEATELTKLVANFKLLKDERTSHVQPKAQAPVAPPKSENNDAESDVKATSSSESEAQPGPTPQPVKKVAAAAGGGMVSSPTEAFWQDF